uniref:Putative ovule protein n=1 Tax=Solanum chacoense TaxID=4108 RepID=A0A0V0H0E7_SOLCH
MYRLYTIHHCFNMNCAPIFNDLFINLGYTHLYTIQIASLYPFCRISRICIQKFVILFLSLAIFAQW